MSEWQTIDNLPSKFAGTYEVKLENGIILKANYYQDRAAWIGKYGYNPSHWWDYNSKEALHNVVEWREIQK